LLVSPRLEYAFFVDDKLMDTLLHPLVGHGKACRHCTLFAFGDSWCIWKCW